MVLQNLKFGILQDKKVIFKKLIIYYLGYHSLAPMYYRGSQAAIVVYDITNQVI